MNNFFFETFHNAFSDFPYFDDKMYNINYISHFHDEVELVYVLKGSVSVTTTEKSFVAKEKDICIFMPGEIHSFTTKESNHLYIIKINCKNSVSEFPFSNFRCDNHIPQNIKLNSELSALIETLSKECTEKNSGYAYAANAVSNRILTAIIRRAGLSHMNKDLEKLNYKYSSFLNQVNEYMNENYMHNITLDDIARHCNFSKYYFTRLFKQITQTTFYEYLTVFRLEKALQLLKKGNLKRETASQKCGFPTSRAFYRAFKLHYHTTIKEYLSKSTSA